MKKKLLSIFMLTIMLVSVVSAGNGEITAYLRDFTVKLDDKDVELKDANGQTITPIVVNGSTYLPVRTIGETLGLSVDWNGDTQTVLLSSGKKETQPSVTDKIKPVTDSELSVVAEYQYKPEYFHHIMYYLLVKNNSSKTVKIGCNATAYNGNDIVGAASYEENAIAPQQTTLIPLLFENIEKITEVKPKLKATEEEYYKSIQDSLKYEITKLDKKIVISAENTGAEPLRFVEATVLFFKDGEVITRDSTYFVDDDSEIKPNDIISKEISSYKKYDDVKVFFRGRINK